MLRLRHVQLETIELDEPKGHWPKLVEGSRLRRSPPRRAVSSGATKQAPSAPPLAQAHHKAEAAQVRIKVSYCRFNVRAISSAPAARNSLRSHVAKHRACATTPGASRQ